ncbi:MAG TPA: DNA-3-methyladenine glycosylase [Thermoanaerobaculia bacterium]|nr:DNA-3-methyladenine glycosylase [Thermoanaerobaculia bacterium]
MIPPSKIVPRAFYRRDSREVAPDLLNKVLVCRGAAGRIVEVEAYVGAMDPASHAYRGRTARNATMFGPPGHLYVYFTYGMHWCANAVCEDEGAGSAVLIRALAPLEGVEAMRERRGARPPRELCSGPARLCQALAIDRDDDGADLVASDRGIHIVDDGAPPPLRAGCSRRIGLSRAVEHPWRWFVVDDPNVSRARAR